MTVVDTFKQFAKATIGAFVLLAPPMASLAAAHDKPGLAVEFAAGWVGFADDGIVNESLVGGAVRWYLRPQVSVGPEVAYMRGAQHSHLMVTGNVAYDVLSPTNRPRPNEPVRSGGRRSVSDARAILQRVVYVKRRGIDCRRRREGAASRSRYARSRNARRVGIARSCQREYWDAARLITQWRVRHQDDGQTGSHMAVTTRRERRSHGCFVRVSVIPCAAMTESLARNDH